jgi:aryl carrier-like protein
LRKAIDFFRHTIGGHFRIWNVYGPAEATIVSTYHQIDLTSIERKIPIGRPLSNYKCLLMDEFLQPTMIDRDGELFIGGVGVFAGYLGCDDLTNKALIDIGGELFYRTGDLVRMNDKGLLHYVGRKDHQIQLHGQRIELGEIEQCLLNTSITACIVMKWNDDHLIAYVESSCIDEKQLREHCQFHLPSYMIPSIFIVLEQLPLNSNGKVDRKLLPSADLFHLSSTYCTNNVELLVTTNEIEVVIHHIWCDIFQQNQISTDANAFSIGAHSLLLMRLFHRYKTEFRLEINTLSFTDFFQHPTIIDHARLIDHALNNTQNIDDYPWSSLNLNQGKKELSVIVINYLVFV